MDLPVEMDYDTTLATEAYELADRWDKARDTPVGDLKFSSEDVAKLNSNQKSELKPMALTHLSLMKCSCVRGAITDKTSASTFTYRRNG